MSTGNRPFAFVRGHIAFRLWGAMMVLAGIGVVFLWVVQIALFEPNYIDASAAAMFENMGPLADELSLLPAEDESGAPALLGSFSKSTNVRVYLVDAGGDVLISYSNGKPGGHEMTEAQKELQYLFEDIPAVLRGESRKEVNRSEKFGLSLNIGVPTTYRGDSAAVFVHQSLSAMQTMQELNRNQLVMLSIIMAMMASLIAVLLTRSFTRPIHNIEDVVKRLAEGELTAKPDVRRGDELGRLSHSVEELGLALQRVDVLRKEVIANVSHELSAPLSLILGYGEMVRDITGDNPELRTANMDLIIRETTRLSRMVDDIMDYSKFQAGYGALNIVLLNLNDLIVTEVEAVRQAAADYHIEIEIDSDAAELEVEVDPLKISQVIRNLLNNAINHTAEGETVSISIAREREGVRVNMTNPGRPISQVEREIIWERYQRVQHQNGRREGTGIGLSIVSTILEAHGIAYGVESDDTGNTFWFSIPRPANGQ